MTGNVGQKISLAFVFKVFITTACKNLKKKVPQFEKIWCFGFIATVFNDVTYEIGATDGKGTRDTNTSWPWY